MMGLSLAEVREAAWWEYQAILWNWNDRHATEDQEEAEAPDAAFVERQFERLAQRGLVGSIH